MLHDDESMFIHLYNAHVMSKKKFIYTKDDASLEFVAWHAPLQPASRNQFENIQTVNYQSIFFFFFLQN